MVGFYAKLVGKYTSPMDPMGYNIYSLYTYPTKTAFELYYVISGNYIYNPLDILQLILRFASQIAVGLCSGRIIPVSK